MVIDPIGDEPESANLFQQSVLQDVLKSCHAQQSIIRIGLRVTFQGWQQVRLYLLF